ncbi:hypothetical protein SLA2020_397960 [Shorea laevis]
MLGESLLSPWYLRASSKCSSLNTQMRLIHHFTFSTSSICAHTVISTALSLCCSIMRGYFLASLEGTPIGGYEAFLLLAFGFLEDPVKISPIVSFWLLSLLPIQEPALPVVGHQKKARTFNGMPQRQLKGT